MVRFMSGHWTSAPELWVIAKPNWSRKEYILKVESECSTFPRSAVSKDVHISDLLDRTQAAVFQALTNQLWSQFSFGAQAVCTLESSAISIKHNLGFSISYFIHLMRFFKLNATHITWINTINVNVSSPQLILTVR